MNVFKNIYTQISVPKSRWKTALMLLDHLLSFVQLMGNLLRLGEFNVRVLKLGLCFLNRHFRLVKMTSLKESQKSSK